MPEPTPLSPTPRVYVFDLDGVLYRGAEAVPHAAETLARLRALPDPPRLYFLTNNSSQTRVHYRDKLVALGMPCDPDEIVTSASATAAYLAARIAAEEKTTHHAYRALAVGGEGILDELARVDIEVERAGDPMVEGETFDYVVVGLDRSFDYARLNRAQQAILNGALFIATNRDGQYPMEGGRVIPGGGAIVAAIQACTDRVPVVVGKPEVHGLRTILDASGVEARDAVMVGDRLDTDILCGNALGVPTVFVLTGVTSQAQADALIAADPGLRPSRTITDLREL